MARVHPEGLFEATIPGQASVVDYRLRVAYPDGHTATVDDPYRYGRVISEYDVYLFGQGKHTRIYDRLGAHLMQIGDAEGVHFGGVGPQRRTRQRRRGFQSVGRARPPDAPPRIERRVGDFRARRRRGRALQVRDPVQPPRRAVAQDRSVRRARSRRRPRRPRSWPAPTTRGRTRSGSSTARGTTPGSTGRWRSTRSTSGRGRACRRTARSLPHLRRAGRPAHPLRQGDGLYAHRAAAGDGASVLRLLGISGHRVLRADRAIRHAAGIQGIRRRVPPQRHRRDSRLGARTLPEGRARPRQVRRHRAVRARRPPAGRASRLGNAGLQLRPQRGPQLPAGQCAVLARGVPHRRPAGGRGRLDALPRLLAPGRANGCRTGSAAARTSRRSTSCASSTRSPTASIPGRSPSRRSRRRGPSVSASDLSRRARVHLQVEHGVDERHPASTSRRTRSTAAITIVS